MIPNGGWRLDRQDGALVLHAGADLRYAIDGIAPPVADEVLTAWGRGSFDRATLSADAAEVADQLATAGALRPAATVVREATTVDVVFVGTAVPALDAAVRAASGGAGAGGFAVLVRTTGKLADLAAHAARRADPYLVVDVAYHHTISLGPFVVPGQTACAGCLAGRLSSRWGDDAPPARPTAAHAPVTAAVVAHEVAKGQASGLVNRTVPLDLDRWRTVEQAVLRLPWCAVCGTGDRPVTGRIDLPWATPEPRPAP